MLMAFDGDPVGIRTLDLLIRSQSLYPAELPSHVGMKANLHSIFCGRGRRNRTLNQWFWRPLLYQLSYTPTKISGFLSSQGASPQVLSAFAALTAVFGMGTGGSPQLSPLNLFQDSYPDNCIKMFVLTSYSSEYGNLVAFGIRLRNCLIYKTASAASPSASI